MHDKVERWVASSLVYVKQADERLLESHSRILGEAMMDVSRGILPLRIMGALEYCSNIEVQCLATGTLTSLQIFICAVIGSDAPISVFMDLSIETS